MQKAFARVFRSVVWNVKEQDRENEAESAERQVEPEDPPLALVSLQSSEYCDKGLPM